MRSKKRPVEASDWRAIANLGEQLGSATSLKAQKDRITSLAAQMVRGNIDVWLHEELFRLPDRSDPRSFPRRPRSEAMQRALSRRKIFTQHAARKTGSQKSVAAVPIEDHGLVLGVLQVTRPAGPAFEKAELSLLQNIAAVVAVGLYAALRVEVERFRLGELMLVRRVSAEIATVLHLDELARRVCELIQKTFNYYYVAIFTLKPGNQRLRFRSSATSRRGGARAEPLALEVEVGQGLIGSAASTGDVINVPDVKADPRYRFLEHLPATRSEVAIPLKLDELVLGVLDVQSDRPDAFHPNDVLVLEALADNVARAVEGARLYSDLRRRAEQLAFLADVSRSVTSTLNLSEMMAETAGLIHERFGYQHVSLFTVHPTRRRVEYEAGSGKRSAALKGYSIPLDDERGIIPWVAREGTTLLANDTGAEPRFRPSPLPPKNTKSELAVPLLFGERVLGVLDIQSDKRNAFSEDDRLMFEAVGGTIAAAIRNADLFRSEQWRRQVADSLREVAGLLSKHIGVDEALQALLTELERNLPVEVAVIWLMQEEGMYVAAAHGAEVSAIEEAMRTSPEMNAIVEDMLKSGKPIIRKPSDPMWPTGKAANFPADYSSLAVPMKVSERAIGVMALAHHERGRYGHEASAMVETYASYAAVAIENNRLYDAAQEQAYAAAALLQVAQAVASPDALDDVLASVMRIMPILLGVSSAALFGWDAARQCYVPRTEFGLSEAKRAEIWDRDLQVSEFLLLDAAREAAEAAACALKDEAQRWTALKADSEASGEVKGAARLLIAMPVTAKSDVLGVLLVEEGGGSGKFRARRLEIIQGISQQIALAMQNDLLQNETVVRERLETEIQLARQIQKTFIPSVLPERTGWELAARWETARQVGGDFFDVIELSNGRLGLLVADVADKGMPAALFMALTRTVFRAAVSESDLPDQVLRKMNDLLMPDTGQGMFVTAVYAVLDPQDGLLTYANAGHNPPLWLRRDGTYEKLTRTTIALGILDGPAVTARTIQVMPGESVLMYTDGLTEAFSAGGDFFGESGLLAALQGVQPASAESLIGLVQAALTEFVGNEGLQDDLTMLALRRT
ncbi:MAG TPA: GAF domain-containing protein [Anaerolineales bacterium]